MAAMGGVAMALDPGGGASAAAARSPPMKVGASNRASFGEPKLELARAGKISSLCEVVDTRSNSSMGMAEEIEREGLWSRMGRAWRILFPGWRSGVISNAEVAKKRLKMILIADRCSVTDEAKRKILDNIVGALADFVEIEPEERVELNVSSDVELGTLYSVTVPVRRVRPQYQDCSNDVEISTGSTD